MTGWYKIVDALSCTEFAQFRYRWTWGGLGTKDSVGFKQFRTNSRLSVVIRDTAGHSS